MRESVELSPDREAPVEAAGAGDLVFPVAPDYLSLPPRVDPQAMLARLEETLPWLSTRPGETERRLAAKVDVEFILSAG